MDTMINAAMRYVLKSPALRRAEQMPCSTACRPVRITARLALGLLSAAFVFAAPAPAGERSVPDELRSFFISPAPYTGESGSYASPLRFYDGRMVSSAAEWPARRAEILRYWHTQMGPWPELLAHPKIEFQEKQVREGGIVQHRVLIEVAPGVMQHGFLLVPPTSERRPAVLVPYYAPEVSVAYDGPRPLDGQAKKYLSSGDRGKDRDFAWQLAQRGFVTLAIGSPGDDAYKPLLGDA